MFTNVLVSGSSSLLNCNKEGMEEIAMSDHI